RVERRGRGRRWLHDLHLRLGWTGRRRRRRGGGDSDAEAGTTPEHHLLIGDGELLQVRREGEPPRAEAAPQRWMALQRLRVRRVRQPRLCYGRARADLVLPVFSHLPIGLSDEGEPHGW